MSFSKKLILGTMRMRGARKSLIEWADFYAYAFELGVNRIHCSSEYEDYQFLIEVLAVLRKRHPAVLFDYVVKLAAPNFEEANFDEKLFVHRVHEYETALHAKGGVHVQWMWRNDLGNDTSRCDAFKGSYDAMRASIVRAKKNGSIKSFYCFPYSLDFAGIALNCDFVDGIIVYRNPLELSFESVIEAVGMHEKHAIVIRPFAAGKLLSNEGVNSRDLFLFSALLPGVNGVIASVSSKQRMDQILSSPEV